MATDKGENKKDAAAKVDTSKKTEAEYMPRQHPDLDEPGEKDAEKKHGPRIDNISAHSRDKED